MTITADIALLKRGKGCEYQVDHHCKARIPLIGGKVEKYILSQTDGGAQDELDYLQQYLKK